MLTGERDVAFVSSEFGPFLARFLVNCKVKVNCLDNRIPELAVPLVTIFTYYSMLP